MGERSPHRNGRRCCDIRRSLRGLQSAARRSSRREEQSIWKAGGPWTLGHGHRDRLDQPGSTRGHGCVPGDSGLEVSPPDLLRRYDSRVVEGFVARTPPEQTARRRHLGPADPEAGRPGGSGRARPNPRAIQIRDCLIRAAGKPERGTVAVISRSEYVNLGTHYSIIEVRVNSMTIATAFAETIP